MIDPVGYRGAIAGHPVSDVDAALPVLRMMVAALRDHHVRNQAWDGHAALDRVALAAWAWKVVWQLMQASFGRTWG